MQDYRELLKAYMRHVIDCESISFIDVFGYMFDLSDEQKAQLETIEREVRAETNL